MNITNTTSDWDISISDNSHIFGIPLRIWEGVSGSLDIPIIGEDGRRSFEKLGEWCEKVRFLEEAGIEMHLNYRGENG